MNAVDGPRVVLGVAGGIAAYKSAEVLRRFTESGHRVRVVPTPSALEFVGAATFEALSGQPVHTGVFADVHQVPHVRLGKEADLVVVAPATADLLARAAQGRADDLLIASTGGEESIIPEIRRPDGVIAGTTSLFPGSWGEEIIAIAQKMINGEAVEPFTQPSKIVFVTPANVDEHFE